MATVAKGAVILANGYDLSCFLQSINESADTDMLDATTLCATNVKSYAPGLTNRTVSGEAFFSSALNTPGGTADEAANIDGFIKSSLGNAGFQKITIGNLGAASGAKAALYNADQAKGEASAKVGNLIMISFSANAGVKSSVPPYQDGIWLLYAPIGSATNSASYDNAAGATGYFVRIHNASAVGTISWQLEHSTNNSTWVAVASGTVLKNSVGESFNAATAMNRYVRVVVNSTSGTSVIGVAYVHGFSGVS